MKSTSNPTAYTRLMTAFCGCTLACGLGSALAQTGRLNDTGQSSCYGTDNAAVACNAATVGNTGSVPHQDGRYGRDAAAAAGRLAKVGSGSAGFDFTRICWNGAAEGSANCTGNLVANTSGTPSTNPTTDWACTRDNVTGLVWSLQSRSSGWDLTRTTRFRAEGHDSPSRCGYGAGWRLPAKRELFSIVHLGVPSAIPIDTNYFPDTKQLKGYWTSDVLPNGTGNTVFVIGAGIGTENKLGSAFSRLVHDGL